MRLTIRVQLALAFAVPLLLLVVSTMLALAQLRTMNASSDAAIEWTTTRAKTREVLVAIVTYRLDVRGYVLYHDAKNAAKARASAKKIAAAIEVVHGRLAGENGTLRERFDAADGAARKVLATTGALYAYANSHRDDVVAAYGGRTDTPARVRAARWFSPRRTTSTRRTRRCARSSIPSTCGHKPRPRTSTPRRCARSARSRFAGSRRFC